MRDGIAFVDGNAMSETMARVHYCTSCLGAGVEREHRLRGKVERVYFVFFE